MKKLAWILGIWGLAACQNIRQEVEPNQLSEYSVRLIVACFISPQDTVIAAKVARSRPILDDETVTNLEIANATVLLQTGSRSVALSYHRQLRYYRVSPAAFPIRAGETYHLVVQTPDGHRVEATTTVPAFVELQQVLLDSEIVREEAGLRKRFFTRFSWSDLAAQTNYYQTEGIVSYRCPSCPPDKNVRQTVRFANPNGERALYTDQASRGQSMISSPGFLGPFIAADQPFFPTIFQKPLVLTASLLHLNSEYYFYHKALEQQRQSDQNPFAEPVPIPTNIRGGLGCFGASNRSVVTVRVE